MATACTLPNAAQRSSKRLQQGWDLDENGAKILWTGPTATLQAAGELALYSLVPPGVASGEPRVKWFRFYDRPMRVVDNVAIVCHLDRSTHIQTIRPIRSPIATEARHESTACGHQNADPRCREGGAQAARPPEHGVEYCAECSGRGVEKPFHLFFRVRWISWTIATSRGPSPVTERRRVPLPARRGTVAAVVPS